MIYVDEDEYDYLLEQNKIVYKAIEYIKERYDGQSLTHTFDKDNVKELLDILKGSVSNGYNKE